MRKWQILCKNWDETAVNCILSLISYLQCKKFCCQRSCANKYIKLYMGVCIYIIDDGASPPPSPKDLLIYAYIYSICRKESSKTQNYICIYICMYVYWLYINKWIEAQAYIQRISVYTYTLYIYIYIYIYICILVIYKYSLRPKI